MAKSFMELVVGDLNEKRDWRRFMKRVNALPQDYRFAFKKIQHYIYNLGAPGCGMNVFMNLLELFEASAAEGKLVLNVVGSDVAAFCDELVRSSSATDAVTAREMLNREILEHFHREGK